MTTRAPYNGLHRKLVLAFDVGTTFSGISYSILDPGEVPEIRGVTRFPAQERITGDSKVPTVIYYDRQGIVRAVGAEAMREGVEDDAEEEGWTKAEWFKLHLCPKSGTAAHVTNDIPPLPEGQTVIGVFADFLRYLHQCSRTYIEDTHANGTELWRSLEAGSEFVLTHPNGWGGGQQSLMRKAAVAAGLIPDTEEGHSRLSFVTEGKASLHFCIQSGLTSEAIKSGKGVLIVDAGKGTIDISAYCQTSPTVQSFDEIAAPQCHFQGSIFVTLRAGNFLKNLLQDSQFSADVPHIIKMFDKTTKPRFRSADELQYIKFGSPRDRDPKHNIERGQLKISGRDVASFFDPSVECIIKSIEDQCESSMTGISSVFLVGDFEPRDYLYSKLSGAFAPRGLEVSRLDGHGPEKVVADGAVFFYIDRFVATQVSKFTDGVEVSRTYRPWTPLTKDRTLVVPQQQTTDVETAHISDYWGGRTIEERSKQHRERQERIQSLEENTVFQTLVKTTQEDLMNAVNRSNYLQRQVKQLTSEKDIWLSEKSQILAKERAKEKEIQDLDETNRRQESEIQMLKQENATFQTSVKTAQGALKSAADRSDSLQCQVKQLASEKGIWLSEKSQMIAKERATEKEIHELDQIRRRQEGEIQSLKQENATFQTSVKTAQGALKNSANRSDNLQRRVDQLTNEKDIWLSEKSQIIAKERAKEEWILGMGGAEQRQEGVIQSLKQANAKFQTLVKTAQGALVSAANRSDNLQRQVKQLTREKDIWLSEKSQIIAKERAKEKEILGMGGTEQRQEGEIQLLKQENAELQTLVKTSQRALVSAANRFDNLERQVKQLTSEQDIWSSERSQMIAKGRANEKEIRELDEEKSKMIAKERTKEKDIWELDETQRRQEGEIRRLQEKLRRSEERNNQLEKLLDVQTADPNGSQVLLTTADAYSGADILKMVEELNADIFQGAAFVAELLKDDAMMAGSEERVKNYLEFKQREKKPTFQIGNTLLDYLVVNHEQLRADPLPLQFAFQAFLTWWCVSTTERLFGGDAGREIQKIYQRIRDTEVQSVAGRWRAITLGNSKTLASETYTDYVMETLLALLAVCGWTRSGQKSNKAILSIHAIVMNIAKLSVRLKNAIKEDVTNVDMQIFSYDPGAVYDAESMDDVYGEMGSLNPQPPRGINLKPGEKTLCTVELGLKTSLVKHSEDGKPYEQIGVILKPKVALVSVLAMAGSAASRDDAKPAAQDGKDG